MKNIPLKITVIISIFLNVLLVVLLYNNTLENQKNYGSGDSRAYNSFVYGLNQFEQYLGNASEQTNPKEALSSLINGNERLKRSISSYIVFKNSMQLTQLNSQYIETALSEIDEATFDLMVKYSLDKDRNVHNIEKIKDDVNEIIQSLPNEYSATDKKEFIRVMNQLN